MKNITSLVVATIILLSVSSCAKKYTCECEGYTSGPSTKTYKFRSQDEPTATAYCKSYENGGVQCELQ